MNTLCTPPKFIVIAVTPPVCDELIGSLVTVAFPVGIDDRSDARGHRLQFSPERFDPSHPAVDEWRPTALQRRYDPALHNGSGSLRTALPGERDRRMQLARRARRAGVADGGRCWRHQVGRRQRWV